MLRRPSTFVSNRGEALGAPPPGGKTDETEVGGPPATAAPARGGRVGGAGAGKLVPRARDGRLGAVHRLAGRTVASPRRGGRARCRDVACTRASFWSGAHRERLRGRGPRGRGPGRTGRRGAAREAQVGARRSVSAGASLLPLPERTGRAPCGAQGADRGPGVASVRGRPLRLGLSVPGSPQDPSGREAQGCALSRAVGMPT